MSKNKQKQWVLQIVGVDDLNSTTEMAYDVNGNLTKDLDRDIVTIKYNLLNLPEIIQFKNGNQIRNLYDASGQKLQTRNYTVYDYTLQPIVAENTIRDVFLNEEVYVNGTDYIGNVEYHYDAEYFGGEFSWDQIYFSMLYNPEGYCQNLTYSIFNYYRRDHLGNNREVWGAPYTTSQGTTVAAATIQRTQYYPSGLPWASNSGDNPGTQNKKYNGKEFVEMHGLDEYDSEARWFYPAINRTTTIDPLAEKYYSISPYAWCGNNPVRMVDLDGRVLRDTKGNIVYSTTGQTGTFQHPSGSTATLEVGNIFTDDGTPIQVFKNVSGDAGWNTNCHGTTFADGQYWLNNDQVPALLKGDGYKEVSIESAKKEDKIVYNGDSNSEHSMTITKTDGTMNGTEVYGQGGLEVENHTDKANNAWNKPQNSTVVRKETPDKIVTDDQNNKIKSSSPNE